MVKVAKSRVADRNIGLPAFHLCYSLEVELNRLAIGGIGSEKKIRHVLVGGGCIPSSPPLDPPLQDGRRRDFDSVVCIAPPIESLNDKPLI